MSYQIHDTTLKALTARHSGSLRGLAVSLGFPPSFATTLSNALNQRPGKVSRATENRIREAMGLEPVGRDSRHRLTVSDDNWGWLQENGLSADGAVSWLRIRLERHNGSGEAISELREKTA